MTSPDILLPPVGPALTLREAADRLEEAATGPADLSAEHPDIDACTATLMRQHAVLVEHGGSFTDTPRLLAMARQIVGEAS